jgi:hypothetical protein
MPTVLAKSTSDPVGGASRAVTRRTDSVLKVSAAPMEARRIAAARIVFNVLIPTMIALRAEKLSR